MERGDIRINQNDLVKQFPDQFARERLFKQSNWIRREYLIDGEWTKGPPSKRPEDVSIVFPYGGLPFPSERLRMMSNAYSAWRSLMEISTDEPFGKDEILDRLEEPILLAYNRTMTLGVRDWDRIKTWTELFVPWGVRPSGSFGKPEETAFDRIQSVQDGLSQNGVSTKVLLMPADLYATEVNRQVNKVQATEYFEQVASAGRGRGFNVVPWSTIREEYLDDYQRLAAEFTIDVINELIPKPVIESAKKAAGRRSGFTTDAEIEAAAYRYLRERLCEAVIIEERYRPIKVSAVAKYKDNFVDRELPRVYVMPSELQFPWLK